MLFIQASLQKSTSETLAIVNQALALQNQNHGPQASGQHPKDSKSLHKKITPASDPKQVCGEKVRRSWQPPQQNAWAVWSMSVFSFQMRSKLGAKYRCLRSSAALACKIHVSICSTRSIWQDLCKVHHCQDPWQKSRKIHASGFARSIGPRSMFPGRQEDPCLQIHVSVLICANPRQRHISEPMPQHDTLDPRPRSICKIHVSGACINTRAKLSYPCLSIHVLIWAHIYKQPYRWAVCKIHVAGYITRSVAQCLRI